MLASLARHFFFCFADKAEGFQKRTYEYTRGKGELGCNIFYPPRHADLLKLKMASVVTVIRTVLCTHSLDGSFFIRSIECVCVCMYDLAHNVFFLSQ